MRVGGDLAGHDFIGQVEHSHVVLLLGGAGLAEAVVGETYSRKILLARVTLAMVRTSDTNSG
jgi:hypothetical protein